MAKSIYSLVLDDDLVALLDRMANKCGKSRSAVANDILARELSYETPEMRIHSILDSMHGLLSLCDDFGVNMQDSSLSLRSVLSYRYNPTIRYTLEVQDDMCILRVNVRSRAEQFMYMYELFMDVWLNLERQNQRADACFYSAGKFTRQLMPKTSDMNAYSAAISEYVQGFDSALKQFFDAGDTKSGEEAVSVEYTEYVKRNNDIIQ